MTNAWEEVRAAIEAVDTPAVVKLVTGLDDEQRREVAAALPGHLPVAQEAGRRREHERAEQRMAAVRELAGRRGRSMYELPEYHEHVRWSRHDLWIEPMRVAGAATIVGAAAVATWLSRPDLQRQWDEPGRDDVPFILDVVSARPVAWQQDLAVRFALRLRGTRPTRDRRVQLALRLLRHTGAVPPAHDPLTLAWIVGTPPDRLSGDPLLDTMVPRLFETEGAGRLLTDDAWPAALAELARTGRIARQVLLDGCLTRFLRGGEATGLRFFVRLHERLDPAPEEVADRLGDYLALLPASAANVADLALKQVQRGGPVPAADAGEAVQGLLFRKEGKLVRAGLAWLDRLLKDGDDDLDAYAPALAAALLCEAAGARERAVRLAVKHAARFGPAGAETLREAVATLPAHQGAALAAAFGGDVAAEPEPETFTPGTLPPAPQAAPMPPPLRTPGELGNFMPKESSWIRTERWLDAFVRLFAGRERDRLPAALTRHATPDNEFRGAPWWHASTWAGAMIRELTDPGAESRIRDAAPVARRIPEMTHAAVWKLMPLIRYAEVYQALVERRLPPYLLATPTRVNGLLDPGTLVERLEGYERAGVEALPVDLRQALLRLGRSVEPEVAARAARLTGEAGRRVARWLTDRPADPVVTLHRGEHLDRPHTFSEFSSGPEYQEVLGDLLVHRWHEEELGRTLAVFAGHRELVAARCVRYPATYGYFGAYKPADVALLADGDGPAGPGMSLMLAYSLVDDGRDLAVEAFLRLAAGGGVAGEEAGRRLAEVLRHGGEGPKRALAALREAALKGAHREVWEVMAGWLTASLPGPGERATAGHTRMVSLAADVASWVGARGELPMIAELASRRPGSELVRQARRLHACLTTPPA
ncbi:DUF6493 family protein [Nonomuraea sp. NPDC050478]|uniref:DUF7824 domain-containing protein n=1 Tax=Nonomuraea sp. NPDC050478 TaxID=3364365 RepID=UPI0037ACABC9